MNMISISIALAVVGFVNDGDDSALDRVDFSSSESDQGYSVLESLPSWHVFALNPSCCTFNDFVICWSLQLLLDTSDSGGEEGPNIPWGRGVFQRGLRGAAKTAREEPGLYAVIFVWLVVGAAGWTVRGSMPFAVEITRSDTTSEARSTSSSTIGRVGLGLTSNRGSKRRACFRACDVWSPMDKDAAVAEGNRIAATLKDRRYTSGNKVETNATAATTTAIYFVIAPEAQIDIGFLRPWWDGDWGIGLLLCFTLGGSWPDGGWDSAHICFVDSWRSCCP